MSYVDISGRGFYSIDKVLFGNVESNFTVINDSYIRANVPARATYDNITVLSTSRNKSGESPMEFVPIPFVVGYSDNSWVGSIVRVSGDHLSGVTGVTFNNILSSSVFTNPITDNGITSKSVFVPSGQVRGSLKFYTPSGLAVTGPFYEPSIFITNLVPTAQKTGEPLRITGLYFVPELLEAGPDPNSYYVYLGNSNKMVFYRPQADLLTGLVGTGATTGPVQFARYDGGRIGHNGNFTLVPGNPTIQYCIPTPIRYLQESRLYGSNFFNVTSLTYTGGLQGTNTGIISGWVVNSAGTQISVPSTGFRIDYPPVSGLTGNYAIIVNTLYGSATGNYPTLTILPQDIPGSGAFPFTGVSFGIYSSGFTGVSLVQTKSGLFTNNTYYNATYTFPAYSGYNWYGPAAAYQSAYGMSRAVTIPSGSGQFISLSITGSGNFFSTGVSGQFSSSDGYNNSFLVYISFGA